MEFKDGAWEGQDVLPSWAGYQSRLGPYTSLDKTDASDGTVKLSVVPPGDGHEGRLPAPAQHRGYADAKGNGAARAAAIQDAVLVYARNLDPAYGVPQGIDLDRLRAMIGLGYVHVLPVERDGVAYVGYEIGCDWDEDHACGVMTHRDRIVSVGQADEAFEGSAALEDGGTEIR